MNAGSGLLCVRLVRTAIPYTHTHTQIHTQHRHADFETSKPVHTYT